MKLAVLLQVRKMMTSHLSVLQVTTDVCSRARDDDIMTNHYCMFNEHVQFIMYNYIYYIQRLTTHSIYICLQLLYNQKTIV